MGIRPDRKTLSRRLLEHRLQSILGRLDFDETGGPRLLDFGGVGRYRHWLPPGRLVKLDLDPNHKPDVVGRAEAAPLRDGSFDLILSTEMLEHCPEPARVADESHRLLRKGGTVVLTTPFIYIVHGWPEDYYRYTASGLKHLFRRFETVETHGYGNRFVVLYDLLFGFAPFVSSWVNPVIGTFFREAISSTCPAGHILVAVK
jgi:SAM-dependent methyltransferase